MSKYEDFVDEFQKEILDRYGLRLLDPVEQCIANDDGLFYIEAIIQSKDGERTVHLTDVGYVFMTSSTDEENFWLLVDMLRIHKNEDLLNLIARMKKRNLVSENFNPEI